MNKLKAVINNLKETVLPLFFIFLISTVNGQVTSQNNTAKQDSVTASKVLDTVPATQVRKDSLSPVVSPADSLRLSEQQIDTVIKESPKPIELEKNRKYVLGGVSVVGNETISEQSILIFSGLSPGQQLKIPGDKLSSSIKRLWSSKLFSNVDVYVTQLDGNAIYLEINVRELDKVGNVRITGLKKSKIEDLEKEIEFQPGSMLLKTSSLQPRIISKISIGKKDILKPR